MPFTSDIFEFLVNKDNVLTRTTRFARLPFKEGIINEVISPLGMYKVQVRLYGADANWTDTKMLISVTDQTIDN